MGFRAVGRLYRFWRKRPQEKWEAIRYHWNRWCPWLPLPTRLPWGVWWIPLAIDEPCRKVVERLLKSGMVVFDVGAHHGFYTLLASKRVGSQGFVVAFEPSPRELKRLRQHLTLNRCSNVRVEPMAVSSGNGTADFFVVLGGLTVCNSLREPQVGEPIATIQVPVITLDRYIENNGIREVDFIKIDTEGADLEVLKGASSLLQKLPRPIFMCELFDDVTKRFGYEASEIYEFLHDRSYSWFQVTMEGMLQPTEKKTHYRDIFNKDFFAVPKERLEDIVHLVRR